MNVLIESEKATLGFNKETNAIELIWKSIHDETTYRHMFIQGIEYLKEYKATCWLSDIRKEGVVSPTNSKWLQEEVIPEAMKNGLKKIAVVMDADIFKKFYVQNIEKSVENKQNQMMKYFDSVELANAWFKE